MDVWFPPSSIDPTAIQAWSSVLGTTTAQSVLSGKTPDWSISWDSLMFWKTLKDSVGAKRKSETESLCLHEKSWHGGHDGAVEEGRCFGTGAHSCTAGRRPQKRSLWWSGALTLWYQIGSAYETIWNVLNILHLHYLVYSIWNCWMSNATSWRGVHNPKYQWIVISPFWVPWSWGSI